MDKKKLLIYFILGVGVGMFLMAATRKLGLPVYIPVPVPFF